MIVWLFNAVLYASIVGCIVAAMILLLKLIFRKYFSARWHYLIWLVLVVRLLVPVSFGSNYSMFSALNVPDKDTVVKTYTVALSPSTPEQESVAGVAAKPTAGNGSKQVENGAIPLSAAPAYIWALVACGLFLYTAAGYLLFSIKVHRLPQCDEERVNGIFKECRKIMGIGYPVRLLYMRANKSPALTGIFRPSVIIAPQTAKSMSDTELRHIFMHELSHYKSKDIAIGLVITLTQIIHWFNPIVLFCMRFAREECEVACDFRALSYFQSDEQRQYGRTIVKLCEIFSHPGLHPWVTGVAGKGQIKRRIRMIINFKKASVLATVLAVILSLLIGCSALVDKKAAPPVPTVTPIAKVEQAAPKTSGMTDATASANIQPQAHTNTQTKTQADKNTISLSGFSSVQKYIKNTMYENPKGSSKNRVVTGSFDLNGDGKAETISVDFKNSENGIKTAVTVGSHKLTAYMLSLAGVYAVDLDTSDHYTELAVVANGYDADVDITFYRYDGTLRCLGTVYGSMMDQPVDGYFNLTAYNIGVLADGKGRVIPRLGVMRYVSPQIMLSAYEIQNEKLLPVKLDLSQVTNKTYTVTSNVQPYFEAMQTAPTKYVLRYSDSDKITIKAGSKVTFKSISTDIDDSFSSFVTLENGKKGLLYFFVRP